MRYAMIMAGGSGTRLWPMSRGQTPKQLIPFIGGRSLLELSVQRLRGLTPADGLYICAGASLREAILRAIPEVPGDRYLAEPMGRDTLNAVGLAAAVIAGRDPEAVIGVFTADHVIEPIDRFRATVTRGFELAEAHPRTLVTFGIWPTHAATGYGYLELGSPVGDLGVDGEARVVSRFKEKPDADTARAYHDAGPSKYLWNSGMFVWKARTLLDCIERFAPENHRGLMEVAEAWESPDREGTLDRVYPTLKKISIDYAVMEPASRDDSGRVRVAAVPMPLTWLDVGSWPSFAQTLERDPRGNAASGCRHVSLDDRNVLVVSGDPSQVVATLGCEDLIIVHTAGATLVARTDRAEDIKKLHALIGQRIGPGLL